MRDLVQKLKDFRLAEQQALEQLTVAESELKQSEPYQVVLQCQAYLDVIRAQAIVNYHQTQDKNPVDGVSVVINKVLEYLETEAILWSIANAKSMLKLDKKQFEKHAKQVSDTLPLEFVTIKEEPSVRIASKL